MTARSSKLDVTKDNREVVVQGLWLRNVVFDVNIPG